MSKYVCANCFLDIAVKDFIEAHYIDKKCDYCDQAEPSVIVGKVFEFIERGVHFWWTSHENAGDVYDHEEAKWFTDCPDTDDLLRYKLEISENEELLEDLRHHLGIDNEWCEHDLYGLPQNEIMRYSWASFARQTKKTRYVFFLADNWDREGGENLHPAQMLTAIGEEISKASVIKRVLKGQELFRARKHKQNETFTLASQLGSPPLINTQSNRMSPIGISMFYGAFDPITAVKEVTANTDKNTTVTVATFKAIQDFYILDLTSLPRYSYLDENNRHRIISLQFLRNFAKEISKPIQHDGKEHIEYVPTQIFTEYIQHIYKEDDIALKGILYPSSKNQAGIACVLFFPFGQCYEAQNVTETTEGLELVEIQQIAFPEDMGALNPISNPSLGTYKQISFDDF